MKNKMNLFLLLTLVLISLLIISPAVLGADLELEEAVEILIDENRELENARKDVERAEKDVELARRSYFPTVELQSSYTKMGEESEDGGMEIPQEFEFLSELTATPDENYSTSLSVTQPLWAGGKVGIQKEIAAYGVEIARADYEKILEEQIFNLIQSYYGVLQAEALVEIREEALERVEEHLKVVESNLEAGTAVKQDQLQSKIEKRDAEKELTAAKNDLKISRRRLGQLLASEQEYSVKAPAGEIKLETDKSELIQKSIENNSDLLVLELNREITKLNKKLEGEYYRPDLSLNASYDWEGEEFPGDESWSVTAAFSLSLYDGGSGKVNAEKIDRELEKLANSRQNLLENLEIEIEDSLLTVEENEEAIELEKLSLENAEENLEIANNSYEAGAARTTEVTDAQTTYNQAQIALMQAEYNYQIELFRTIYKSGSLKEYFEDVIADEK